jgi:hypothetical protein
MLKRFVLAFVYFVALLVPVAFGPALLAAPASPAAPIEQPGCERNLAAVNASVADWQARVKNLKAGAESCIATRLYFLELTKARAVTALCRTGSDRDRELGRLDADVAHINEAIAARCG